MLPNIVLPVLVSINRESRELLLYYFEVFESISCSSSSSSSSLPLFLFSLPIFHSRHARHDFYRAIWAKKCFTEFLRVDFFALAYVGKNNWKLFTMHIILLLLLFVLHLLFAFVLLHLQK